MVDDLHTVWSLIILYGAGSERYIFRERSVALQQLYEYVKDCWNDALPKLEIPDDRDEAIEQYFSGTDLESYILVEDEVLEAPVRD